MSFRYPIIENIYISKGTYQLCVLTHNHQKTQERPNLEIQTLSGDTLPCRFLKEVQEDKESVRQYYEVLMKERSNRITVLLPKDVKPEFVHIKRVQKSVPYRADFHDYCFSLRDHVNQLSLIRRYLYDDSEEAKVFRALRSDLTTNTQMLAQRIEDLNGKSKEVDL